MREMIVEVEVGDGVVVTPGDVDRDRYAVEIHTAATTLILIGELAALHEVLRDAQEVVSAFVRDAYGDRAYDDVLEEGA